MNFSGPQGYRNSTWIRPPGELSVEREDLSLDNGSEKQVYEGELARVRRENASLRDQLQRTLKELRSFQVKYPSEHLQNEGDSDDLPPWVTSSDVMTPLLRSYDARIAELESLVNQQTNELENFHEKIEEILAENEALRDSHLDQMRQNEGPGGLNMGPMGPLNMELLNELNERVEILMTENALMVEQKAVLSKELEENLSDLEERTETISQLSHQLGVLSQDNKSLKQRASQAEKDREEAAKQTMKYSDSLSRAETEVSELKEQLEVWIERCQRAESQVTQLEKDTREIISRSENDGMTTMRKMKAAEDYIKELQLQLLQKTQDAESAQEVARKLKREYQSTRQDAEGMLQVMSGLERQLSEYSARETEVERIAKDSKEKVEEALVLRDQALTREEQLRREIERLQDDRKKHALLKQNEIDSAVEVAKGVAGSQIRSLEQDIEELTARVAKFKAEADKSARDCKSAESLLEKTRQAISNDRKSSEQAMRRLEERISEVIVEKEDAAMKTKAVYDLNTELRLTIDKLRTHEEAQRTMLEERDRIQDKEVEQLRLSLRDVQRECAEATKNANRRHKELSDLQREFDEKYHDMLKKKDDELLLYQRRAAEAERNMKEMEVVANAEEHRVKILVEQFKERSHMTSVQSEAKLNEYRERIKTVTDRNRDLDNTVRGLEQEKKSVSYKLEEARNTITRLQDQSRELESEVADLTAQLASSLEAREKSAKKAAHRLYEEDENIDENYDVDSILQELGE